VVGTILHEGPFLRGRKLAGAGVVAGAVGGLAEVIWVSGIAPLTHGDPAAVAQGVTETLFPALAGGSPGVALGIFIHFALAVALGLAVAILVRRIFPSQAGRFGEVVLVTGALALVWMMNFGVILPLVNPQFVTLLPLWASLVSKLLFGVAAALALQTTARSGQARC